MLRHPGSDIILFKLSQSGKRPRVEWDNYWWELCVCVGVHVCVLYGLGATEGWLILRQTPSNPRWNTTTPWRAVEDTHQACAMGFSSMESRAATSTGQDSQRNWSVNPTAGVGWGRGVWTWTGRSKTNSSVLLGLSDVFYLVPGGKCIYFRLVSFMGSFQFDHPVLFGLQYWLILDIIYFNYVDIQTQWSLPVYCRNCVS